MLSPEKSYFGEEEAEEKGTISETEDDESFSSVHIVSIENVLKPTNWEEDQERPQKKTPAKTTFCLNFKNDSTFSVVKKAKPDDRATLNNGQQRTFCFYFSSDGESHKNRRYKRNYMVYDVKGEKDDDDDDKRSKKTTDANNANDGNIIAVNSNKTDDLTNRDSAPNLLTSGLIDPEEQFIQKMSTKINNDEEEEEEGEIEEELEEEEDEEIEEELEEEQGRKEEQEIDEKEENEAKKEEDFPREETVKKTKSVRISPSMAKIIAELAPTEPEDDKKPPKKSLAKKWSKKNVKDSEKCLDDVCLGVDKCFQLLRDGENEDMIVTHRKQDNEDDHLHPADSLILLKRKSQMSHHLQVEDEEGEDEEDDDKNKKAKKGKIKVPKKKQKEICKCPPEEVFKRLLTQQEFFNNLLKNYEKENKIAEKLSRDKDFLDKPDTSEDEEDKEELQTVVDLSTKPDRKPSKARILHEGKKTSEETLINEIFSGSELHIKKVKQFHDASVSVTEIGKCFQRGFRENNVALSGDRCFIIEEKDEQKYIEAQQSFIDFSEKESPLEYLLALGFSVDEASNALKDEDISNRLNAAIIEARVWVNTVSTDKGTLLYLLAYKAKPVIMRYYLHLVEAIINGRITDAVKLDGFMNLLQRIEEGKIDIFIALGIQEYDDEETESKLVKQQVKQVFLLVHKVAEEEALKQGKTLSNDSKRLLIILSTKYRAGLVPHLEMIARYIGQGLLINEVQLEAAMIYLSRLNTPNVKTEEFEHYCAFKKPET